MSRQRYVGTVMCTVGLAVLFGIVAMRAQEKPLVSGQPKVEPIVTVELADLGLPGTSAARRVTIAPGITTADHTHTASTLIIVMLQGSLTDVRGKVKNEYNAGDVVAVAEGTTHHAENHGTVPIVYVEINTTAKK